jgi:hypothetical protein
MVHSSDEGVAASFRGGGAAPAYIGTFPALLSAWGFVYQSLGPPPPESG